ncbi:hypothetical protein X801_04240, partial [Opisthorchis viverrini]
MFRLLLQDSYWPVLFHTIAVLIVAVCIFGGIRWIEKANMFLVPMLLGILLFTFGWSLTRQYAEVGITFIFTPEWSSMLTPSVWVQAATQNAFDTGAAMALFVSYSAYFTRKNGAVRFGSLVPLVNNSHSTYFDAKSPGTYGCRMTVGGRFYSLFCLPLHFGWLLALCRHRIFHGIFYTDSNLPRTDPFGYPGNNAAKWSREYGTHLYLVRRGDVGEFRTFLIPVLFAHVEGIGRVLCSLFFLCLSFAGVTSLIGHVQLTVITLKDLGLSHRKASFGGLALTLIFGMPSAININVLTNQ